MSQLFRVAFTKITTAISRDYRKYDTLGYALEDYQSENRMKNV